MKKNSNGGDVYNIYVRKINKKREREKRQRKKRRATTEKYVGIKIKMRK